MGWINRASDTRGAAPESESLPSKPLGSESTTIKTWSTEIEDASDPRSYSPVPESTEDADLPEIDRSVVLRSPSSGRLWVVIDQVVYDCTEFAKDHPGGAGVLQPFKAADCSWQFWRFHGPDQMEQYGRALRVGRTAGIENKFREPPRYVGLRKLFSPDDW